MRNWANWAIVAGYGLGLAACQGDPSKVGASLPKPGDSPIERKLAQYTTVRLTTDLGRLSGNERRIIPLLIDAARSMDAIFWWQAYGSRDSLLESIKDPGTRRYAEINYEPADRLDNNAPFIEGVGPKPAGSGFYPHDVTKEELEAAAKRSPTKGKALRSQYTIVRRDSARGLLAVPYHEAYADQVRPAVAKLREAARLADDPGLKRFLELRAKALETDDYQASDLAWLDMKDNTVDVVIGPIETYEDQLFGYKAANEAGQILRFQGDGDYAGVTSFMAERGRLSATLQQDLVQLGSKGIPVDIVFEQGPEVLR